MTMDLWYDLAVREHPVLDDQLLDKLDLPEAPKREEDEDAADVEPTALVPVDFF